MRRRLDPRYLITHPPYDGDVPVAGSSGAQHWVRWHESYDDPDSALSFRLRLVQDGVRAALDCARAGTVSIVSMCAGQGRDVIDVVAAHARRSDVRALLVESDSSLVMFARQRAAEFGVSEQVEVVQGDASLVRSYTTFVPADLVLICGVFGNVSAEDIRGTVARMPSFCAPEGTVIWTRHRRSPDLTPSVRGWFADAGFDEVSFAAPPETVLSVGCSRLAEGGSAGAGPLDPDLRLFDFVGDGSLPA
jgi:hypothetical protein